MGELSSYRLKLATLDEGSAVFRSGDDGWVTVVMPRATWEKSGQPTELFVGVTPFDYVAEKLGWVTQ